MDEPQENETPPSSDERQGIFDEQYEKFQMEFGAWCDAHGYKCAMAIIMSDENPQPMVSGRGPTYDLARGLAGVLRSMKRELFEELDA